MIRYFTEAGMFITKSRSDVFLAKLHRTDGPAVEYSDGTKMWYVNGQKHREGGPAIEWGDGTKVWCLNGQVHRRDGPAIEYASGKCAYFLKGERIKAKDVKKRLGLTKKQLETKAGRVAFAMSFK